MLKHVVLWNLKEQDNKDIKFADMKEIRDKLYSLKPKISEIKNMDICFNDQRAPKDNYDVMLILECEDFDALKRYAVHPEHVKVVEFVKTKVASRVAIDYFE